jgi:hypothetical protein
MMKDERLQLLMDHIETGLLSRNKHFDLFKDPLVREARRRVARLRKLHGILNRTAAEGWQFRLAKERGENDQWMLTCRSDKLNIRWSARLRAFELDRLRDHPTLNEMLTIPIRISPPFR